MVRILTMRAGALGAVAVDAVVRGEEVAVERLERVGGIGGMQRDFEVVGLADVADIGEVADLRVRSAGTPSAAHQPGASLRRGWRAPVPTSGHVEAREQPREGGGTSCSIGADSRPAADSTPGCGGTAIASDAEFARQRAVACSGPPPPSGSSA